METVFSTTTTTVSNTRSRGYVLAVTTITPSRMFGKLAQAQSDDLLEHCVLTGINID